MAQVIGICEDDAALRSVLVRGLEDEGFEVAAVGTGREAIERFGHGGVASPDAIVLDVGLPDADGRDVCQALRATGVTTPVLFLTARDAVVDRVAGFRSGGDDYLAKPFVLVELIVRLEALLRRAQPAEPRPAASIGLVLDPAAHTVATGDESVLLTPTEFRLLGALAREPGAVVRRRALVKAGWPDGATVHDNTLDSYLARLRRKLRDVGAAETIVTVRGVGYRLQ